MNSALIHSGSGSLATAEVVIVDAVTSEESRRAYVRAVRELIEWCQKRNEKDLTKAVVNQYRSYLISRQMATATINQKLSAIRRLAVELGDSGTLQPNVSAAIARVKGVRSHGVRLGQWLTLVQA